MDEFGAVFQFFEGFGENWHALNECLCYLDEWLPADAYVLVITDALSVLAQQPAERQWLFRVLTEVAEWWATPIEDNDRFNRPARPFHTVLQCLEPELRAVLELWPGVGQLRLEGE